jgi:hypothetical protein
MSKKNNMGLGIAFGAGLGIIFGEIIFNNIGVGIGVGVALGIVFAETFSRKSNDKKND